MICAIAIICSKATFSLSLTNDKPEVFHLQWRKAQELHRVPTICVCGIFVSVLSFRCIDIFELSLDRMPWPDRM